MKRKILAIALGAALAAPAVSAGTVTVLTSFPKELTTAYKKAFEAPTPASRWRS